MVDEAKNDMHIRVAVLVSSSSVDGRWHLFFAERDGPPCMPLMSVVDACYWDR